MRKVFSILLAILLAVCWSLVSFGFWFGLISFIAKHSCGAEPTAITAGDPLALHNAYRALHKLPPLQTEVHLTAAAQAQADFMARTHRFSHVANGTPMSRALAAGYPSRNVGENIAQGQRSWDEALQDWETSAGHRRNILGAWTHVGCAQAGGYWVVVFGQAPAVK